jgi:23S rRNA pseudouridine1911/1915/1917 synthase
VSKQSFIVEGEGRLDAAVRRGLELGSRRAKDAIRKGKISVDGVVTMDPSTPLRVGQEVGLDMSAPNPIRAMPHGVRLVHRDDHLLVVDKPAGLLTTPTADRERETTLAAAMRFCRGGRPPKVVHRLDKLTSGLVVFGRGVPAARALRAAIDAKTMQRRYWCVVAGAPRGPSGLISSVLVHDTGRGRRGSVQGSLHVTAVNRPDPAAPPTQGRFAITRFWTVAEADGRAALEIQLSTGRTHQIRIHLAEIGCPVLGEAVYGKTKAKHRQALHAAQLVVPHPQTGEPLEFASPWPVDLVKVTPIGPDW